MNGAGGMQHSNSCVLSFGRSPKDLGGSLESYG
jgi:hypothetical protein